MWEQIGSNPRNCLILEKAFLKLDNEFFPFLLGLFALGNVTQHADDSEGLALWVLHYGS